MTEPTNGTAPVEPEAPKVSRIVLAFPSGPGTSQLSIAVEHCDEGQINAAAYFLDLYARDLHAYTVAQRLQQASGMITPVIPGDVQRVIDDLLAKGKR